MSSGGPFVLAVDDESGILRLLHIELSAQGFRVLTASNGKEAVRMAEQHRPDIALLDILMPGASGLELMKEFRERWNMPIILLTARDRDSDRVDGLTTGADDYIIKPFNPLELGGRVRAVLRRGLGDQPSRTVRCGDLEIDLEARTISRAGVQLPSSPMEWRLLSQLARNCSKVMLNRELLELVWGPEYVDDVQYLRVWVSRLRQKIEPDPKKPRYLITYPGLGYCLRQDGPVETQDAVVASADDAGSTLDGAGRELDGHRALGGASPERESALPSPETRLLPSPVTKADALGAPSCR